MTEPKFRVNDKVVVKTENVEGSRRTPLYVRGKSGRILKVHGPIPDYEFDHAENWGPLYSVIFEDSEIFDNSSLLKSNERTVADLHESWLEVAGD